MMVKCPAKATILRNSICRSGVIIRRKYNPDCRRYVALSHKGSIDTQHRAFIREGNNLKFLAIPILSTILILVKVVLLISSAYATIANIIALVNGLISFIALYLRVSDKSRLHRSWADLASMDLKCIWN